jgi:alpha-ribazole phosphatase
MAEVLLVRHAPVNVRGMCYGQHDVGTEVPPEVAAPLVVRTLGKLGRPPPQRIWSSPWSRTRELARALALHFQLPLYEDPRLSELNFGRWEGRLWSSLETQDSYAWARWMREWRTASPPGGEALPELLARVEAWLNERVEEDGLSLAVTHAGVIRAAHALAAGAPDAAAEYAPDSLVPHLSVHPVSLLRERPAP